LVHCMNEVMWYLKWGKKAVEMVELLK
jgi:hypothetical protein